MKFLSQYIVLGSIDRYKFHFFRTTSGAMFRENMNFNDLFYVNEDTQ